MACKALFQHQVYSGRRYRIFTVGIGYNKFIWFGAFQRKGTALAAGNDPVAAGSLNVFHGAAGYLHFIGTLEIFHNRFSRAVLSDYKIIVPLPAINRGRAFVHDNRIGALAAVNRVLFAAADGNGILARHFALGIVAVNLAACSAALYIDFIIAGGSGNRVFRSLFYSNRIISAGPADLVLFADDGNLIRFGGTRIRFGSFDSLFGHDLPPSYSKQLHKNTLC